MQNGLKNQTAGRTASRQQAGITRNRRPKSRPTDQQLFISDEAAEGKFVAKHAVGQFEINAPTAGHEPAKRSMHERRFPEIIDQPTSSTVKPHAELATARSFISWPFFSQPSFWMAEPFPTMATQD
jgi:hypothetical protein